MGMETMVFFALGDAEICGRVDPASAGTPGQPMRLCANVDHMHLVDPDTDLIL
jgi:multiple sugar transport system ATP-binding protein